MLMSKDWMEKKEKRIELKDCSSKALEVAVDFMYGINIPKNFTKLRELLHIAVTFQMVYRKVFQTFQTVKPF